MFQLLQLFFKRLHFNTLSIFIIKKPQFHHLKTTTYITKYEFKIAQAAGIRYEYSKTEDEPQ